MQPTAACCARSACRQPRRRGLQPPTRRRLRSAAGPVALIDVASGETIATNATEQFTSSIAFAHGGRWLVTVGWPAEAFPLLIPGRGPRRADDAALGDARALGCRVAPPDRRADHRGRSVCRRQRQPGRHQGRHRRVRRVGNARVEHRRQYSGSSTRSGGRSSRARSPVGTSPATNGPTTCPAATTAPPAQSGRPTCSPSARFRTTQGPFAASPRRDECSGVLVPAAQSGGRGRERAANRDGHVPVHGHRGFDAPLAGAPGGDAAGVARHDEILRDAIEAHDGHVVKTTGDGFHAAFATAHDAVDAAVAAQLALASEEWPVPAALRVRMGIHSGPAELRDGDYYGTAVNRAARLMSVAHGGQIVVSLATEELVPRRRGRAGRPGRAPAAGSSRVRSASSRSRTQASFVSFLGCRRWSRSRGTCRRR